MKKLVELLTVADELATLRDIDTQESFQVPISNKDSRFYSSMLNEAKEEELESESAGVFVIYDKEQDALIMADDESGLF